jgi:hypothetical protein
MRNLAREAAEAELSQMSRQWDEETAGGQPEEALQEPASPHDEAQQAEPHTGNTGPDEEIDENP